MTTVKLPKKFALIGSPVAHSLSPILHKLFANQFEIDIRYELLDVNEDNYLETIKQFFINGGLGLNVTAPLKNLVCKHLKNLDKTALIANSVNTITIKKNGSLHGYNTDGIGLLYDLKRKNIILKDSDILVLGAGGAVRGIVASIFEQRPSNLILTNRDIYKAKNVASEFKQLGDIQVIDPLDLCSIKAKIIINATSATPQYLHKLNFNNTLCYDLNYVPSITEFMRVAAENGALGVYNGLGMLVEQAAAAFILWHNLCPNTQNAYKTLTQLQANTV
jgi:shikimate dehydrogenase